MLRVMLRIMRGPKAPAELYGEAFFSQMCDCRDAYRRLADAIQWVCWPFSSVVDIGCGLGYVHERLGELGMLGERARGIDAYAPRWLETGLPSVVAHDLTTPWTHAFDPADLVICTETAEHLPESASDTLVATCVQFARRWIVWSAAPPGQAAQDPSATGHVNEQDPSYWLDRFRARGWAPDGVRTDFLRMRMRVLHAQHEYAADSFYVLVPEVPR